MINEKACKIMYALGAVDYGTKEKERAMIDLGEIDEDWKGYFISKHIPDKNKNPYYMLFCDNCNFGVDEGYCNLADFRGGWLAKHMCALIISAIEMHKSENKKKT